MCLPPQQGPAYEDANAVDKETPGTPGEDDRKIGIHRQAPDKQTQLLTRTHPVASHVTRFICGKIRPPDAG